MSLLQDNLEQTLSNGARLADLAAQLTETTTWKAALRSPEDNDRIPGTSPERHPGASQQRICHA